MDTFSAASAGSGFALRPPIDTALRSPTLRPGRPWRCNHDLRAESTGGTRAYIPRAYIWAPPSIRTSVPVTKKASGLPSIATTEATAPGSAKMAPSGSGNPGATRAKSL